MPSVGDEDDNECDRGFDVARLPACFRAFLEQNDIDPAIYTVTRLPRYIRLNTHLDPSELPTLAQLRDQLQTQDVWAIPGLEGFFGFYGGGAVRLVDMPAYKQHHVFGIDLSSALAVAALEVGVDEHVLDLCCAPGAKLCMVANLQHGGLGTVTGVDIARHRLETCRALLKKYQVGERARLFEADGTSFAVPPPSRIGSHILDLRGNQDKSDQPSSPFQKPFWAPKTLRFDTQQSTRQYDKVLVDAECTHDGSISHIIKYESWGWDRFVANFMDPHRLATIAELQRALMAQGWSMCAPGGLLVYSTCSLTVHQNEDNVAWFLATHSDAQLEPIPQLASIGLTLAPVKPSREASASIQQVIDSYCVRFDPLVSRTSGFFVARFRKAA